MQAIAGGFVFRRVSSPIHSLDPRVKLLFSLLLLFLSTASDRITEALLVVVTIILLGAIAKIMAGLLRTFTYSATFAFFILVINALTLWNLEISTMFALRFLAILSSTSLFFLTTSPDEMQHVMKSIRLPRDFVFAFVIAIRFIPVLMMDAIRIIDAQKSRGLELEKGNLLKRARNLVPVLVPLMVTAITRSAELAEAMETRAYGAVDKPTTLYVHEMRRRDWSVASLASIFFMIAVLYFYEIV